MSTPKTLKTVRERIIGIKNTEKGKKYIIYIEISEKALEKLVEETGKGNIDEKIEEIIENTAINEEKIRETVRKIIQEMGAAPVKPRKPETEKPPLELGELREAEETEKKEKQEEEKTMTLEDAILQAALVVIDEEKT